MNEDDYRRIRGLNLLEELKAWYDNLPPGVQSEAKNCIRKLNEQHRSLVWIYIAIQRIEKHSGGFRQWQNLAFYAPFIQENDEYVEAYHRFCGRRLDMKEIEKQMEAFNNREVVIINRPKEKRKPKYSFEGLLKMIEEDEDCVSTPYVSITQTARPILTNSLEDVEKYD